MLSVMVFVLWSVPAFHGLVAGAQTYINSAKYIDTTGFDTCIHPSAAGLHDWWIDSPFFTLGNYLGGSNSLFTGCDALSLSVLDSAINEGWASEPIWYGPQWRSL
jgi:hypothetical protein